MPMPKAIIKAPAREQPFIPIAKPLKLTPTANPSGILCHGITPIIKMLRFFSVALGSALSIMTLLKTMNKPPVRKPIDGKSHELCQSSSDKLIAGIVNDQIDAAIINPALILNIMSRGRL